MNQNNFECIKTFKQYSGSNFSLSALDNGDIACHFNYEIKILDKNTFECKKSIQNINFSNLQIFNNSDFFCKEDYSPDYYSTFIYLLAHYPIYNLHPFTHHHSPINTGKRRYNIKLWKTFTDCFNCLPIAAIIDEKIFTMHGGLSPDLQNMEQIRRVMRPTDVPDTGMQ